MKTIHHAKICKQIWNNNKNQTQWYPILTKSRIPIKVNYCEQDMKSYVDSFPLLNYFYNQMGRFNWPMTHKDVKIGFI